MLKSIWINLNRIAAVFCVCIMAYFFVIGAVLAGALLKSLAGAAIVLVISIPKILFAVANAIVWIVSYAFTHPVDTAFTTLGGIVVLAIVMGHNGFFDESEQVIRRGSRLQAASSVRRRLSGQGQMPSNSEHQAASPLQHRRGSRLTTAASNRKPFSPPITWQQKLLSLLGLGRWLSLGNQTNSLSHILRLLQQSVLSYVGQGHGYRGLCYDAKQDMYPILSAYCDSDRIKLLNPFDARGVAWDIAKDVNRSSVAMEIAFTLIPEVSDNSPFFRNAARHSAWGIMCSYMLSGHDWSFADLLRGLRDEEVCQRILARHYQTEHLIRMYYRDAKLVNDIFATIASATMLYEPIAASWEKSSEKIALSDCMDNEYIVVLGNSEVSRQTIDRLNAVLFKRWTDLILSQPDGTNKRFWTFVDELSEAGYLSGLPSFLKKARSKGGRCVVACQSIEGLRSDKMYGDKVTADFLSCFGNRMFTRLECAETAEFCSKYIGDQEIVQTSETKSGTHSKPQSSVSYSKVVQRTVLPSEFMNIPNCGSANGLTAMYKMRSTPACWDTIPADQLFNEWLIPKAPGVDEFVLRDAMGEFLEPWSLEQESQFAPPISQSLRDKLKKKPKTDLGQSPPDIQDLDF